MQYIRDDRIITTVQVREEGSLLDWCSVRPYLIHHYHSHSTALLAGQTPILVARPYLDAGTSSKSSMLTNNS